MSAPALAIGRGFPWLSHRTLREVADTAKLAERWDYGENLSPEDRRRLVDLMSRAQRAGGAP